MKQVAEAGSETRGRGEEKSVPESGTEVVAEADSRARRLPRADQSELMIDVLGKVESREGI